MAAILAQDPLVAFRLLCGKVSRDFPLNMAKIGIASANRDQSPIRSSCSHWRNSPLKPMLSATSGCRLITGTQPAKFKQVMPLRELSPDALPFFVFPASLLISTGIALACDKNV